MPSSVSLTSLLQLLEESLRLHLGGAERLVVDAAVSLQNRGHTVIIFTSRHDRSRCFEETRDGSSQITMSSRFWTAKSWGIGTLDVRVLGSSLPMRFHSRLPLTILFSILRSIILTTLLLLSMLLPPPASPINPLSPLARFDVFLVDQQSVCIPLLRWIGGTRVIFYCHFPDKLLSGGWEIGRDQQIRRMMSEGSLRNIMKRIYRWPVDRLEEWTTGMTSRFYTEVKVNDSFIDQDKPM